VDCGRHSNEIFHGSHTAASAISRGEKRNKTALEEGALVALPSCCPSAASKVPLECQKSVPECQKCHRTILEIGARGGTRGTRKLKSGRECDHSQKVLDHAGQCSSSLARPQAGGTEETLEKGRIGRALQRMSNEKPGRRQTVAKQDQTHSSCSQLTRSDQGGATTRRCYGHAFQRFFLWVHTTSTCPRTPVPVQSEQGIVQITASARPDPPFVLLVLAGPAGPCPVPRNTFSTVYPFA